MEFTPNDFDSTSRNSFPILVKEKVSNRLIKLVNPSEIPMDVDLIVLKTNFTGEVDVQTIQAAK